MELSHAGTEEKWKKSFKKRGKKRGRKIQSSAPVSWLSKINGGREPPPPAVGDNSSIPTPGHVACEEKGSKKELENLAEINQVNQNNIQIKPFGFVGKSVAKVTIVNHGKEIKVDPRVLQRKKQAEYEAKKKEMQCGMGGFQPFLIRTGNPGAQVGPWGRGSYLSENEQREQFRMLSEKSVELIAHFEKDCHVVVLVNEKMEVSLYTGQSLESTPHQASEYISTEMKMKENNKMAMDLALQDLNTSGELFAAPIVIRKEVSSVTMVIDSSIPREIAGNILNIVRMDMHYIGGNGKANQFHKMAESTAMNINTGERHLAYTMVGKGVKNVVANVLTSMVLRLKINPRITRLREELARVQLDLVNKISSARMYITCDAKGMLSAPDVDKVMGSLFPGFERDNTQPMGKMISSSPEQGTTFYMSVRGQHELHEQVAKPFVVFIEANTSDHMMIAKGNVYNEQGWKEKLATQEEEARKEEERRVAELEEQEELEERRIALEREKSMVSNKRKKVELEQADSWEMSMDTDEVPVIARPTGSLYVTLGGDDSDENSEEAGVAEAVEGQPKADVDPKTKPKVKAVAYNLGNTPGRTTPGPNTTNTFKSRPANLTPKIVTAFKAANMATTRKSRSPEPGFHLQQMRAALPTSEFSGGEGENKA